MISTLLGVSALIVGTSGHAAMTWPPAWMDESAVAPLEPGNQCRNNACLFFTNNTFITVKPTIRPRSVMSTFTADGTVYRPDHEDFVDYYAKMPWRAPGSAMIYSPCGIDGGNPDGCNGGVDCPGGGHGFGKDARVIDYPKMLTTTWEAGSIVEVAWGVVANHGGGYSYRLCKIGAEGRKGLTEECFQAGHLDFYGDVQWAQYGVDTKNRVEYIANRTRKGTVPAGSQWTKNMFTACTSQGGGFFDKSPGCPTGTQFKPAFPGFKGYCTDSTTFANSCKFNIVDKVKIPANLPAGDYALSFRWDCEQTSQIWNQCSSIKIVNKQGARGRAGYNGREHVQMDDHEHDFPADAKYQWWKQAYGGY